MTAPAIPSVRPDDTATTGLPPRILTPDEYAQAQAMANPSAARFPVQPPAYKYSPTTPIPPRRSPFGPSLVPVAESTRVGQDRPTPQGASPFPYEVPTGPNHVEGVLTKIIDPMIHHPLLTAGFAAAQFVPFLNVGVDSYAAGSMGADIAEYAYQQHLERSMTPAARQEFEASDPNHVSGEQAVADALMMGTGALGSVARAARAGSAADAATLAETFGNPSAIAEALGHVPGRTPSEALPPSTAAEAVRAQVADMTRAVQAGRAGTAAPFDAAALTPGQADEAHLGYYLAAKAPGVAPEYQAVAADRANAINDAHGLGFPTVTPARSSSAIAADAAAPGSGSSSGTTAAAAIAPPKIAGPSPLELARQRVTQQMGDVADAWNAIFSPATRTADAAQAAGILRATTGAMAARYEQAAFKLDQFRRAIEPLPLQDKLGFIDAIEGGRSQPNAEFQGAANLIRKTLDDTRDAVRALGTGKLDHFITNYFPHIWDDPERAAEVFANQEPPPPTLEGGKGFLKERSIPTTADGIRAGLMPVSTNPVDLTLLKLREMQRYIMAHESLDEMHGAGLLKFVSAGEAAPTGFARIDDKVATVFGPREGGVSVPSDAVHATSGATVAGPGLAPVQPNEIGVPGIRIMGQHWAPEPVARIVNNYLSPGLRGNAIYDAYRGLGNTLNQAQLGLSGFHLGATSLNAILSRAALGLEHLSTGNIREGLAALASAPGAPITAFRLGSRVRAAYLDPANAGTEFQALAAAVKEAGGRVRQDSFYTNSAPERLMEALRAGEYGKATMLSLPALFEAANKPLMEHIVPLQKLGAFAELAQKALRELPDDATLAERRAALSSAWDSIDNRFGQLVYDNLFWNRTVKDLAMASTRSVGWNLGTIRELGGGVRDIATNAAKLATGDESAMLTHRAAYTMAVPIGVGLMGAVYQYLRTGQGPTELKDYFYPKTGEVDADGNAERVQLPSYMKDMMAYAGAPWQTIKHKIAPLPAMLAEMLNNQDYYGGEIRNPNDPLVKQIGQEADYLAKNVMPFSLQGMLEQNRRGDASAVTKLGNWFGITPAPRAEVRSDAQNRMAEYLDNRRTMGATPEDEAARQSRANLLGALRDAQNGRATDLQGAVTDAIEQHDLTPRDIVQLLKRAGTTPAQEKYKRLSLDQAIDVFRRSTPREQQLFAGELLKKVQRMQAAGGE